MSWEPTTEAEIANEINDSYGRMSLEQKRLWEVIKIHPEKWRQDPYGNQGNGFWVVALIGHTVIWFNDIEDGFNRSTFTEYGLIDEYWCNQDQLEWAIQNVINEISEGFDAAGYTGPPEPTGL